MATTLPADTVNILLVDDQPGRLLSYESILKDLGQTLVTARSGMEALEQLLRNEFAVILLDVSMPGMDGFETAAMIHDHPRFEGIPIIFVTGVHDSDLDRLKGYRLGAVDYVAIPIVPEILRSKVSVLVELYCQRRELKHLNTRLAASNLALQAEKARELEAVNATLQQANAALQAADRHKDEFLAILAHELRNPLAPIRTAVDVMGKMSISDPQLSWAREVIARQTTQMSRLVDDLLDVSRIKQGTIKLQLERLTLQTVVDQAMEAAQPIVSSHRHTLRVECSAPAAMLEGDPVRLVQMLSNLLSNAAKYMQLPGTVTLRAYVESDKAVFSVHDNGIGLSAEALPKLFHLFSRVHSSEHAPSGLGIGLALVRQLAELHGGTVHAESAGPDCGSVFTVRLPLAADQTIHSTEAPRAVRAEEPAAAGRRVLIADDNADARDSLAMLLQMSGHQVRKYSDGAEALQGAAAWRPDIMLLDIGMPVLDGYEVAKRVRNEPWGRHILLVAISGWGQADDRRRATDAGFDRHYMKPVGLETLEEILATDRTVAHDSSVTKVD